MGRRDPPTLPPPSEWNTQLTMAINFISSKDSDETRTMHIKIIMQKL